MLCPIFRLALTLVQGGSLGFTFPSYTTLDGTPVDLTGYSAKLVVSRQPVDPAPLLTLTDQSSSLGQLVLTSSGNLTVNVSAPGGLGLPQARLDRTRFVYTIWLYPPASGAPIAFAQDAFWVEAASGAAGPLPSYTIVNASNSGVTLPSIAAQTVEYQSSGAQLTALFPATPLVGWEVTVLWTQDSASPGSPPPVFIGNGNNVTPYGSTAGTPVASSVLPVLGDTGLYRYNGTIWVQVA